MIRDKSQARCLIQTEQKTTKKVYSYKEGISSKKFQGDEFYKKISTYAFLGLTNKSAKEIF